MKVRVSFNLSLNPLDPNGKHYVADWIQRAIEENLIAGETMTDLRVDDAKEATAPQYQHEQDCC
jgi:hypothetical protein